MQTQVQQVLILLSPALHKILSTRFKTYFEHICTLVLGYFFRAKEEDSGSRSKRNFTCKLKILGNDERCFVNNKVRQQLNRLFKLIFTLVQKAEQSSPKCVPRLHNSFPDVVLF